MLEHSVHSTILSVVLGSSQASQDVIAALVLLLGWSSLSSLSDNRLLGVVVVVDVDSCWVFSIEYCDTSTGFRITQEEKFEVTMPGMGGQIEEGAATKKSSIIQIYNYAHNNSHNCSTHYTHTGVPCVSSCNYTLYRLNNLSLVPVFVVPTLSLSSVTTSSFFF